jgi:two-component system sensor histidine kinase KdpD
LGLSIVRGFARAHHGEVIAENNPAGGAVFTIRLPVETSSKPA